MIVMLVSTKIFHKKCVVTISNRIPSKNIDVAMIGWVSFASLGLSLYKNNIHKNKSIASKNQILQTWAEIRSIILSPIKTIIINQKRTLIPVNNLGVCLNNGSAHSKKESICFFIRVFF